MSRTYYIFVHGLSGWGSYDKAYRNMPYWGMRTGDLMAYLQERGFACRAASVAPTGSAWDRACELYAQLAGTVTDYGSVHAEKNGHARFGKDFSDCPLIPAWNEETELVLFGHSFGGATVRLFSHILTNGDPEERDGTEEGELSPFFSGGMGECVKALVTLASPMNGTTAYDLFADPGFDPASVQTPWWSGVLARLMSLGTAPKQDGRNVDDYAGFDMRIDNALALNRRMQIQKNIYYFSVPCSSTIPQQDGTWIPDRSITEKLFIQRSYQIGSYTGTTRDGFPIGPEWRENDGLVNTLSAASPLGDPYKALDPDQVEKGVWNVYPVYRGDHMSLQGGLLKKHDIREFYLDMLTMIRNALQKEQEL